MPKPAASEPSETTFWTFDGTSGPLALRAADPVLQGLNLCLASWPRCASANQARPQPAALGTVNGNGNGRYSVCSRFTDRQAEGLSVAASVCSLIADLSLDWAENTPEVIGLHAAAIHAPAGIVIFTGPARAGKTTLVSRLALEPEFRFVCDDVLPIRPDGQALALGIAPRLRLPLPSATGPLQSAMQRDLLLADSRYAYFSPPNAMPYGEQAPIAAFILLDREDDAAPSLWALPKEDALAAFLRQSITGFGSADEAFALAEALLANLPCARLVYSDLDALAAFLPAALRDLDTSNLPYRAVAAPKCHMAGTQNDTDLAAPDTVFEQNPQVISRVLGARHWLTLPEDGTLWEVNPTSRALWAMLEIPGTARELSTILAEDYPEVPANQILRDVQQALKKLADARLIQ